MLLVLMPIQNYSGTQAPTKVAQEISTNQKKTFFFTNSLNLQLLLKCNVFEMVGELMQKKRSNIEEKIIGS